MDIVVLGLILRFVDNKRNIEFYLPTCIICTYPHIPIWTWTYSERWVDNLHLQTSWIRMFWFTHPISECLTELLLLPSNNTPPLYSRNFQALLVGVSMKLLFSVFLPFIGLFPVQLFKRDFPRRREVPIPLILARRRVDRGRRRGRLSAVCQENTTPWAVFAVWVRTYSSDNTKA